MRKAWNLKKFKQIAFLLMTQQLRKWPMPNQSHSKSGTFLPDISNPQAQQVSCVYQVIDHILA